MSERFDWSYPGLNWSHFHSLANLLSLRNGGQAEPSSLADAVLVEDWDPDDNEDGDAPSMDTRLAHRISDSGNGRLKRKFLDCLAEFAANKKGGPAVACTAMKEAEDNVVIWIARNEGFSDADKPVFDKLENLLGALSCKNADQPETLLWEEMVMYHRDRIEHSYIPNLRSSFKAYDAVPTRNGTNTAEICSPADASLSVLRTLLFGGNTNGTNILEKYMSLVIASYNLRQSEDVEKKLNSSSNATSKSKSLWLDICLLARLRVAFQKFRETIHMLPSFEKIKIILVPRAFAPANPTQPLLNLSQTLCILQLNPGPATTKAVLGHNWAVSRVERLFSQRQKQKPSIHAEVQVLMFLSANEPCTSGVFPYLGCSKLSCFMCNSFVQSYGRFMTRGCHGRLFKPWTVPNAESLLPGQADRTARALVSVQRELEMQLRASCKGHIQLERTSAIGGSSVLDGRQEERSQRQVHIDQLRMRAERSRVAEMFRRQTEDTVSSSDHTYPAQGRQGEGWDCDICMEPTSRRCSVCNKGFFCSDSCQEKRSGSHLFTCSKRPITSADYLWKSLAEDLMPQEEEVLEDFGFNNTVLGASQSSLLGVYGELRRSGKFSAEDIHDWRIKGILADKIKEFCHSIPEHSRGTYLSWFLKNGHVLDRTMNKDEADQELIARFYDKARPYLDVEDRAKTARDLRPEAKGASYNLLAEILLRATPNPSETNWYSFGYVTCRGEREESLLLDIYQLLLVKSDGSYFYEFHNQRRDVTEPVTFTQFWKAYESGTLIQLMDSKGLKTVRSRLPFLESFLSAPPGGPRPSVWDLKQFLEINSPIEYPPIPSIEVDYGFINCSTFEETCLLMEIYCRVLKTANPLGLHQACITGNLFEFASGFVRMEERWSLLMRNFYPLEEAVEPEPDPEPRTEVGSEEGEDAKDPPPLLSTLWDFIGWLL